jgi:SAM-dependent methyltransferase
MLQFKRRMADHKFIPPLRFRALTSVYDLACRTMGLGDRLRRFEIGLLSGDAPRRILEVGCGTGELLRFIGKRFPTAQLTGLDPDTTSRQCFVRRVSCSRRRAFTARSSRIAFARGMKMVSGVLVVE